MGASLASITLRYWDEIRALAKVLNSDGCSGVSQIRKDACLEHDVHYRTGHRWALVGNHLVPREPITRGWADARFRYVLQSMSQLGAFSPMAWWRWAGVRALGFPRRAWEKYRKDEPYVEEVMARREEGRHYLRTGKGVD